MTTTSNPIRVHPRAFPVSVFLGILGGLAVQSSVAAQRVARTLPGNIIAAALTNAPAGARISVPERGGRRPWAAHADWNPGDITTISNAVYVCIQGHRSQTDWSPDHVPALWRLVRAADQAPGEIPLWVQPQGAHDAYAKGARVRRGGHVWVSTIANNVWAPGVYGWTQQQEQDDETPPGQRRGQQTTQQEESK